MRIYKNTALSASADIKINTVAAQMVATPNRIDSNLVSISLPHMNVWCHHQIKNMVAQNMTQPINSGTPTHRASSINAISSPFPSQFKQNQPEVNG